MSAELERVGVVGGGIMGTGIAEVCARAGLDVVVVERSAGAVDAARERTERSLARAAERGKVTAEEAHVARGRLRWGHDLAAVADRQLVVEAVVEDRDTKLEVFARLATTVEDDSAILASNTSSIPIVDLGAQAGERGDHVLGMHFFNPVPVLGLVELIPSLLTADAVTDRARSVVAGQLGKQPIIAPDRAGFTVNALLIPYVLAAIRMYDQGLASANDIDEGMVEGCAHPMGPLALADLIGLDTVMGVAETMYEEHREPLFAPPPLLRRLVSAGHLGRKRGRGLYDYAGPG